MKQVPVDMIHLFVLIILFYNLLFIVYFKFYICCQELRPDPNPNPNPENCENRHDPDLVQAFLKKWWVESDFKAPNFPLSLRLKVSGCHYNSIYNNT
jgi:hypothetical protein